MASQNEIANWSLAMLGETSINDISDSVERAELLTAAWGPVRDQLLREKLWRFSIQRASLAADVATPDWGFDYQYSINGDVVRVIQVNDYYPQGVYYPDYVTGDSSLYKIEADKILTNLSAPLKVRWVINSVDVGLWDPCFARVMACDLAERICPRVTGSENILQRIAAQRSQAITSAQRANALEQPPQMINDSTWIMSRMQDY